MKSLLGALAVWIFFAFPCSASEPTAKIGDEPRLERIAGDYENGEFEKTAVALRSYVKDHPRDTLAWTILGNVLEDLDQDEESSKAYESVIAIDARNYQAISGLGILYRKRSEYAKAMEQYRKAVAIEPKYAQAYSSMVIIALKQKNDRDALKYAEKAYQLDKTDPGIAANLAIAHHYNGHAAQRDRFTTIAKTLGYKQTETLKKIYSGDMTVRDQ